MTHISKYITIALVIVRTGEEIMPVSAITESLPEGRRRASPERPAGLSFCQPGKNEGPWDQFHEEVQVVSGSRSRKTLLMEITGVHIYIVWRPEQRSEHVV
jgi:hypothetical protein